MLTEMSQIIFRGMANDLDRHPLNPLWGVLLLIFPAAGLVSWQNAKEGLK